MIGNCSYGCERNGHLCLAAFKLEAEVRVWAYQGMHWLGTHDSTLTSPPSFRRQHPHYQSHHHPPYPPRILPTLLPPFLSFPQNGETERARLILARARDTPATSTPRMWMYSAKLERDSGKAAEERAILTQASDWVGVGWGDCVWWVIGWWGECVWGGRRGPSAFFPLHHTLLQLCFYIQAVDRFPDFWKLWLMAAQLEEREGQTDAARKTYARAVLACPKSVGVWRAYAAFEARGGAFPKARAILDMARLRVPKDAGLWLATVR